VKSRLGRPLDAERVVPHSDGAGTIDAVGADVPARRVGERVWIWNGQWQRPMGTAAEFIVVPDAQAVALPDAIDAAAGACLGIPAMTAFHAVGLLGDLERRTVLVLGTVGSRDKARHAHDAGVAATIDYKREPVDERVKALTGGRGVDAIVDMDFSTTARLLGEGALAPHGVLVSYGSNVAGDVPVPFRALLFNSYRLAFFLVYDLAPGERRAALAGLGELLAAGSLVHAIGARFPLDRIADAHEAVEAGRTIGNVVVDLA
jgi:NADPH2:quinone reductase